MNQEDVERSFINAVKNQGLEFETFDGKVSTEQVGMNIFYSSHLTSSSLPRLNSKYKVYLSPKLNDVWQQIQIGVAGINYDVINSNYKQENQKEIGFYMIGEEQSDGSIIITNIEFQKDNLQSRHVHADESFVDSIVDRAMCLKNEGRKPILFKGHTHPAQKCLNRFQNSWSFGDLYSAFTVSDRYKDKLQTINVLITPSLDVNFLFYDRNLEIKLLHNL